MSQRELKDAGQRGERTCFRGNKTTSSNFVSVAAET